jgi:hypothetical protein
MNVLPARVAVPPSSRLERFQRILAVSPKPQVES